MNYVTESDLTVIQGLMRHLNDTMLDPDADFDVDAEVYLTDSNGESLGTVKWREGGHIWEFPDES